MTIRKIYIAAFGGLKDYMLDFSDGFNLIHGENEQGKTTVMAFLKMMFYGGKGGKDLVKNPRSRYQPWDGDAFGGRVFFAQNGHEYCLERIFKKSDATDRVTLRDTDLGTEEPVEPDVGKRIFGLSEAAFERSVFIGQPGILSADETAEGELNAKLSNGTATGDENVSYQQVNARLTDAIHRLTTKQKVGAYDKNLQRLNELQTALTEADDAAKHRMETERELAELKAELLTAEKERKHLSALADKEADIRNAEKLENYLQTKKELDGFNDGLRLRDGNIADTVFYNTVQFCLSRYDAEDRPLAQQQDEVDALQKDIAFRESAKKDLTPEVVARMVADRAALYTEKEKAEEELNKKQAALEEAEQMFAEMGNRKKAFHPLFLAIGLVMIAAGIGAFFTLDKTVIAAAIGALGLVSVILAFVLRPADRAAQLKAEAAVTRRREALTDAKAVLGEWNEKITQATAELDRAESALQTDEALLNQRKDDLAERQLKLNELAVKRDAAFSELQKTFCAYKAVETADEIRQILPDLKEKIDRQKEIKLKLNYLCGDLGNLSYEAAAEKLAKIRQNPDDGDTDFAALKEKLEAVTQRVRRLAQQYSALESDLKNELKHAVFPDVIERELRETESRVRRQKQYLDALILAQTVLENSFAEMRRGFGSALEKRTEEIFSALTGGKYRNVRVSKSMTLDAESGGIFGNHPAEAFSSGTVDQAYLSLRLAIAEGMTGDERLPIFLDDVLCQYDDSRTVSALQFLKDYAADSQVILFTCHRSICDQAGSLDIACKSFLG